MLKLETHLHTTYGSHCGQLDEHQIAEGYYKAGYAGIIVTDHFARGPFHYVGNELNRSTQEILEQYSIGYRKVKEACKAYGIEVYRAAELRFDECMNDYLVYGWTDDLFSDPDAIFKGGLEAFIPRCREAGAILIQAHPFRDGSHPADPSLLDGIEVFNGHPRHDNRNPKALALAQKTGLIQLSGSDCHQTPDIGISGILVDKLPKDSLAISNLIRSGNYLLITH